MYLFTFCTASFIFNSCSGRAKQALQASSPSSSYPSSSYPWRYPISKDECHSNGARAYTTCPSYGVLHWCAMLPSASSGLSASPSSSILPTKWPRACSRHTWLSQHTFNDWVIQVVSFHSRIRLALANKTLPMYTWCCRGCPSISSMPSPCSRAPSQIILRYALTNVAIGLNC